MSYKMLQVHLLSDEDYAVIDGDVQALKWLLEHLKDVPISAESYLDWRY